MTSIAHNAGLGRRSAGEQEGPAGVMSWQAGGGAGERPRTRSRRWRSPPSCSRSNEAELEQFLGGLLGRVGAVAGRFLRSDDRPGPPGDPQAGGPAGAAGRRPRGRRPGSSPARAGTSGPGSPPRPAAVLGLELEGLSAEDREFETARQFVRFALDAAGGGGGRRRRGSPGAGGAVSGGRGGLAVRPRPARVARRRDRAGAGPPPTQRPLGPPRPNDRDRPGRLGRPPLVGPPTRGRGGTR